MIKCCAVCTKLDGLASYEDKKAECGKCRECCKYDLTGYRTEVPNPWRGGRVSKITPSTKKIIVELYSTQKISQEALAEKVGLSRNTIYTILKEAGAKRYGNKPKV